MATRIIIKFALGLLLLGIAMLGCKVDPSSTTGNNSTKVSVDSGSIKLIFIGVNSDKPMPYEYISTATLIRFDRQPQDEGVEIRRWPGDTSGDYKTVEIERKELDLKAYKSDVIPLAFGLYQIRHNSVEGLPPSGYYGDSEFFEIKKKDILKEIRLTLYPAI